MKTSYLHTIIKEELHKILNEKVSDKYAKAVLMVASDYLDKKKISKLAIVLKKASDKKGIENILKKYIKGPMYRAFMIDLKDKTKGIKEETPQK